MSVEAIHRDTFKKGSRTYFNSSLFFPRTVRDDVFVLYGFVRTADNFVDADPQRGDLLERQKALWKRAWAGETVGEVIVDTFAALARRRGFDPSWVDAFFHSMELDLSKKVYSTMDETLDYIFGSAEVIGLFMARIMGLPARADNAAKLLGRSMQYINFLRDIDEDAGFGRAYVPLEGSPFSALDRRQAGEHPGEFVAFMRRQLDIYRGWQKKAEAGYAYIPRRYLIPIKSAADMYNWTAGRIAADPFVVFRRKVKPSRLRIVSRVIGNAIAPGVAPAETV